MTPSEVAFQMADLGTFFLIKALNISNKFQLRNELALKKMTEEAKTQIKIEERQLAIKTENTFPWHILKHLKKNSKADRRELRKILTEYCRTHAKEVRLAK